MQSRTNTNHNSISHHQINLNSNQQPPAEPKWFHNPGILVYWSLFNAIILGETAYGLTGLVFSVHLKTQPGSLHEKSFRNLSLVFNIIATVVGVIRQIAAIWLSIQNLGLHFGSSSTD